MIVDMFELYEGLVGLGILAGIAFVLHSDRFLVIHLYHPLVGDKAD